MKKLFLRIIYSLLLLPFTFCILPNFSFADIDITVSPVKYDITLDRGQSGEKIAKIFNNTNITQEIFITTKNAISMEDNGQPVFVENIENPELYLANWVTPSVQSFTIGAGQSLDIPFTINVPTNATPGGHYGAIFFNVKENENGQINIQKRIGILLLLKVPGILKAEGEINNISITVNSGGGGGSGGKKSSNMISQIIDKYVLGNNNPKNSSGNTDTQIDNNIDLSSAKDENSNTIKDTSDNNKDFSVDMTIDFSNKGNTHLKPIGKIEIIDENGNILKKIGKESIKNDAGAITDEKVVDYIPINDEDGNVLPNENRKFKQSWNGFAYETLDENGKKIIKYYDPSEYYSTKNKNNNGYLMPWERVCTREVNKKLTAKINLGYTDPDGKEVEFNSARDFYVTYNEEYIGLNWYVITPFIVLCFIIFIFRIIAYKKKRRCHNCKKIVKKDMQVCPYCGEKLKKKK
nr:zinc ribbon domain-containing protein [Candidatus Gracilibacteria bacterium]